MIDFLKTKIERYLSEVNDLSCERSKGTGAHGFKKFGNMLMICPFVTTSIVNVTFRSR